MTLADVPDDAGSNKNSSRTARLEARASAAEKETIQHAADLEGRSLSDFVVMRAFEAAQQVIRDQEIMTLSPRDSRAFVKALLNPPAPNEHLRAAFADYKRTG